MNVARTLRFRAHLSVFFWDALHAVHLIKIIPFHVIHNKTPLEWLPHRVYIIISRFLVLLLIYPLYLVHQSKFNLRAEKYIFLGYSPSIRGHKLYNLTTIYQEIWSFMRKSFLSLIFLLLYTMLLFHLLLLMILSLTLMHLNFS